MLAVDRPRAAADLVEAQLAAGDVAAAEATLAHGEAAAVRVGTAWAAAVTGVARAAVLLARGSAREAVPVAVAAREAAGGAPLTAALARLAEGRALAVAGERRAAVEALVAAHPRSTDSARCDGATRPPGSCAGSATVFSGPRARGPMALWPR